MLTYLIVVSVADEKRYLKLISDIDDKVTVQFVQKENASLFSGDQVEEYVPMIKAQPQMLLNSNTLYVNHNINVYAEPFQEVTLG